MRHWKSGGLFVFLMVAGGMSPDKSAADTREKMADALAQYENYAGAAVEEFRLWKLHQFQVVDTDKVVVWSAVNDAYLITVKRPCFELEYAKTLAVTSTLHTVSRQFDTIRFANERCSIAEIRPIDYRRLRKEQAQKK